VGINQRGIVMRRVKEFKIQDRQMLLVIFDDGSINLIDLCKLFGTTMTEEKIYEININEH